MPKKLYAVGLGAVARLPADRRSPRRPYPRLATALLMGDRELLARKHPTHPLQLDTPMNE